MTVKKKKPAAEKKVRILRIYGIARGNTLVKAGDFPSETEFFNLTANGDFADITVHKSKVQVKDMIHTLNAEEDEDSDDPKNELENLDADLKETQELKAKRELEKRVYETVLGMPKFPLAGTPYESNHSVAKKFLAEIKQDIKELDSRIKITEGEIEQVKKEVAEGGHKKEEYRIVEITIKM